MHANICRKIENSVDCFNPNFFDEQLYTAGRAIFGTKFLWEDAQTVARFTYSARDRKNVFGVERYFAKAVCQDGLAGSR
jgi:hypothetical protein